LLLSAKRKSPEFPVPEGCPKNGVHHEVVSFSIAEWAHI